MNNLGQLPSELLSLILNNVNKNDLFECALINKPIHTNVMPLLWRDLVITSRKVNTILTTFPHSVGHHVRSVVVNRRNTINTLISESSLLAFIQHVPLLEHLTLYDASDITDSSLQHVPRHCRHLTRFFISKAKITQASLVEFGRYCPQLSAVELEFCRGLDTDLFDALEGCPLKEIAITRCDLGNMEDAAMAEKTALAVAGFQQLRTLYIQDYDCNYTMFSTMVWPQLTRVCLDRVSDLDDAMAIRFMEAHPRLLHFELRRSHYITDQTLDAIPTCLPWVQVVIMHSLPRLTLNGIWRLVKNCPTLVGGVSCTGCNIDPNGDDFPEDLDFDNIEIDYVGDIEEFEQEVLFVAKGNDDWLLEDLTLWKINKEALTELEIA